MFPIRVIFVLFCLFTGVAGNAQNSIFLRDTVEMVYVETDSGQMQGCHKERNKIVCKPIPRARLLSMSDNGVVYWHDHPDTKYSKDVYHKEKGSIIIDSSYEVNKEPVKPFSIRVNDGRIHYCSVGNPGLSIIMGRVNSNDSVSASTHPAVLDDLVEYELAGKGKKRSERAEYIDDEQDKAFLHYSGDTVLHVNDVEVPCYVLKGHKNGTRDCIQAQRRYVEQYLEKASLLPVLISETAYDTPLAIRPDDRKEILRSHHMLMPKGYVIAPFVLKE